MEDRYSVVRDPLFYLTVAFFALITTAFPAVLGQQRFLLVMQTLTLTTFTIMAVRQRQTKAAIAVMVIWLTIQIVTIAFLTWIASDRLERAIADGFFVRSTVLEWYYAGLPLPDALPLEPLGRLIELAGVFIGSLVSAGLVGIWIVVRTANLAGFTIGTFLTAAESVGLPAFGLPVWIILRTAGYAGFTIVLAEPILTRNWSASYYLACRRRLLIGSSALLAGGFLLELVLSVSWRAVSTGL